MPYKFGRKIKRAIKKVKNQKKGLNLIKVALFLIIIFLFCWSFHPLKQHLKQKKEVDALEREMMRLQRENKAFKEELIRLKSPEYVERIAREELGLVKPGEETYLVITAKEAEKESQEETRQTASEAKNLNHGQSLWARITAYFRKLFK